MPLGDTQQIGFELPNVFDTFRIWWRDGFEPVTPSLWCCANQLSYVARFFFDGWGGFEPGMPVSKPVPYRLAIPNNRAVNRAQRRWLGGFERECRYQNRCLTAGDTPSVNAFGEWLGRDLNSHTLRRQNLNLVRLPISPLPQKMVATTGFEPVTPSL